MMTTGLDSATMSIKQLGGSLCTRAQSLNVQRKAIHDLCIDSSIIAREKYEKFQEMKDSYVLAENDFRGELEMFWDLLNRTEDMLKNNAKSVETMEVSSNHNDSSSLSPIEEVPVPDSAYSQDETESENTHNVDVSESLEFGVPEPAQQMMRRESVDLSAHTRTEPEPESVAPMTESVPIEAEHKEAPAWPRSAHATPEPTAMKSQDVVPDYRRCVISRVTISAGVSTTDNGFALWRKNKGQKMYTATELYCTKTFGGDTKKLRRYLVAKGGFSAKEIESIRVFQVQDREKGKMVHHARVIVNGKTSAIEDKIDELESSRGIKQKNVIWISRMKRNDRSNKLMVRNFDILSGNDRRRMTQMFSSFGALDGDVKIGRNSDGINFAMVTFRDMEDARFCERTQNDSWYRQDMGRSALSFNGRMLQIGYADNVNVHRNTNSRKTQRKNRKGRW